ncbi:hypothetical protein CEXT_487681 [Caerostris extrusa]|uniref:Uncharacterized protein n=1 Tax=Caerostris extrusa TaxID=172846 RepID=A0AAV4QC29_CAEEX|nr:hypothetical protein CEXT_487681 [Caerostris extrusa]
MSANDINWSFYLDRSVHPIHLDFQMLGVSPKIPKSNDSRQNPDINHIRGHVRACLIRVTQIQRQKKKKGVANVSRTHRHAFEMSSNGINWSFYLDRTVHPRHLDFQMSEVCPKIPKSNDSRIGY